MPGEVDIKIDKPGMYDIYFEEEVTDNSGLFDNDNSSDRFQLIVMNPEGVSMPIHRTGESKKYSYMGRRGESVYEVNLPREGVYEFSGAFQNKEGNRGITLILDMGFSEKRSNTVVTAQAILLFPIVASLILFLYAYSKSRL